MPTHDDLRRQLSQIDGRGYKAYKAIEGSYNFPEFSLIIDHVQGDPFADPSRLRVMVRQEIAGFPPNLFGSSSRRIALRDFLTRQFDREARLVSKTRGTGRSGLIGVDSPGQEILNRTSAFVDETRVELRFVLGLPARGRTVLGRQAAEMLCHDLPRVIDRSLKQSNLDASKLKHHIETAEDADWLRGQLRDRGLVAFVGDGSILPRRTGVDSRPMESGAIPFEAPDSLRVTFDRPNGGSISGMGIPKGVTLIVGGGYHGKSTLLRAIEGGIYDHLPGDGREWVVIDADAVKIRAEDGRRIAGVEISPFINNLPQKQSTISFWTDNASGSTSQAANIMEALEIGAKVLLMDEDTSATNFMIRDHRMQELIKKDQEPITPFIDKIRQLFSDLGVSTILVMGGSGDYFETADTVIAMENFVPRDVTEEARRIAQKYAAERKPEGGSYFGRVRQRIPIPKSLDPSQGKKRVQLKARDTGTMTFGSEDVDLSAVEQIVDKSQVRMIAHALVYAKNQTMDGHRTLSEVLERIMVDIDQEGLDVLSDIPVGNLAGSRRFELAAALNRLRMFEVR